MSATGFSIIGNDDPVAPDCRGNVVAIGNFDGVHRGHQQLLTEARRQAEINGTGFGIVTFEPHPRSFFRPADPLFRLTPQKLKAQLVEALGARFMAPVNFDAALAGLEPEAFVDEVLVKRFGVTHVVTGYDFHFGKGRKGSPDTMRRLAGEMGFGITIIDQVTDDDGDAPFSSSSIRAALRHGDVMGAARQLGYWWTVVAPVAQGDRRGRTIGFPTANIVLDAGSEVAAGIYATRVRLADQPERVMTGASYIGTRPTFNTERLFLEVFLLDFDEDIYGRELVVEFIRFMRPDQTFETVDELVIQMSVDCERIRMTLDELAEDDPMRHFPLGRRYPAR